MLRYRCVEMSVPEKIDVFKKVDVFEKRDMLEEKGKLDNVIGRCV